MRRIAIFFQIFDLCEEVKVNKKNLKAAIGRKIAGNVMKSWTEDFVDEDTGEVVSIERNEVVVENVRLSLQKIMLIRFLIVLFQQSCYIKMKRLQVSTLLSSTH